MSSFDVLFEKYQQSSENVIETFFCKAGYPSHLSSKTCNRLKAVDNESSAIF